MHGPLFSILTGPERAPLITVNCAWLITKRPDLLERLVWIARDLCAVCYDPQLACVRQPLEVLPDAPELVPQAAMDRLGALYVRVLQAAPEARDEQAARLQVELLRLLDAQRRGKFKPGDNQALALVGETEALERQGYPITDVGRPPSNGTPCCGELY